MIPARDCADNPHLTASRNEDGLAKQRLINSQEQDEVLPRDPMPGSINNLRSRQECCEMFILRHLTDLVPTSSEGNLISDILKN